MNARIWFAWPRATLLIASGPDHDPGRKHLFVLLTSGLGEQEEVLLVNLQSIDPEVAHDGACTLQVGDHPFVRHPSFMRYDQCRKVAAEKLTAAVADGRMVARDPMSPEVYDRICAGLHDSAHTPTWAKTMLLWHQNLA